MKSTFQIIGLLQSCLVSLNILKPFVVTNCLTKIFLAYSRFDKGEKSEVCNK